MYMAPVMAQLFPQPLDRHRQGVVVHGAAVFAPDLVEQPRTQHTDSAILKQRFQQIVLRRIQRRILPVDPHRLIFRIERKPARRNRRRCTARAVTHIAHPRCEHRQGKGLGDVVVGPLVESRENIRLPIPHAQDQYGHRSANGVEICQKLETRTVGQIEIQQHHVISVGVRVGAIGHGLESIDRMTRVFE